MSKIGDLAYEYTQKYKRSYYDEIDIGDAYKSGYTDAVNEIVKHIKERIETWNSIYDDCIEFDIPDGRKEANAVLDELNSIIKDEIKDL